MAIQTSPVQNVIYSDDVTGLVVYYLSDELLCVEVEESDGLNYTVMNRDRTITLLEALLKWLLPEENRGN